MRENLQRGSSSSPLTGRIKCKQHRILCIETHRCTDRAKTMSITAKHLRLWQSDSIVTKTTSTTATTTKNKNKNNAPRRVRRLALAPVLARNVQSTRRTFQLAPRTPTRLTVRSAAKRAAMNLFDWNRRDGGADLSPRASRFVVLLRREGEEKEKENENISNSKRRRVDVDPKGVRWCDADVTHVGAHDDETLFP